MTFIYGIIDIDNFSFYNLNNSFESGNRLLNNAEDLITEQLQPHKWRRLDGDEFLFVILGTFECNKLMLTELMCNIQKKLTITLSLGLLESEITYDFEEIIHRLKHNLLIAKNNGKNKICIDYEVRTD